MNFRTVAALCSSGAMIGAMLPTAAYGQTAAAPTASVVPSGTAPQDELADIVVTASRRQDTAQKSALAITAVSGEALARDGITQPAELNKVVTGLAISQNGASTQIFLRGVGSFSVSSYADSAIAFSVDGVFYGYPTAISGSLFDLQRVEVLKGPQGTLYGRNATAGAINALPNRPSFKLGGDLAAELGTYGLVKAEGALNVPLSDTLAIRTSGYIARRDGYFSDGYGNDRSGAARVQALFQPSDDFSVLLAGEYSHAGGKGTPFVPVPAPGDPWDGPSTVSSNRYIQAARDAGLPIPLVKDDGFINVDAYNARAEIKWNIGFADLTVIPSYQKLESRTRAYPSFAYGTDDNGDQSSLELRLSSNNAGPLKWIVGAYGFQSDIDSVLTVDQGLVGSIPRFNQKVRAKAVFGEATYSLTARFRATAGLRYSDENRSQAGTVESFALTPFGPVSSTFAASGKLSNDNVSYKAGLEFDAGSRSLVYVSYASGFKSGGFKPDIVPNTYVPEKLYAYTFGSKNRFFGNTLQVNAEIFYWDYRNHQETYLTPANSGGFIVAPNNVGNAYVWGGNLDLQWRPTKADQFSVQIEYLNSKYKDFKYTLPTPFAPMPGVGTGCAVTGVAPGLSQVDCSGKPFARAPDVAATIGYDHSFDLGREVVLVLGLRSRISSSYFTTVDYIAAGRQGSFTRSDASLRLEIDRNTSITAYVRNIENQAVYEGGFQGPFTPGVVYSTIGAPRTFGVGVARSF